jgi:hypothetical protein
LGGPISKLCVTPPFSINFRCQIENQVSDYRLLGASSLIFLLAFLFLLFLLSLSPKQVALYKTEDTSLTISSIFVSKILWLSSDERKLIEGQLEDQK